MPGERTVLATLARIAADLATRSEVRPPAIVVIGDVVAVADPDRYRGQRPWLSSSRSTTRRTPGSPTTATCATSSCASTSRPSTGCSSPRARRWCAARSRPASGPRSFLMAPRWLDGLADVLDGTDAPCYVVSRGARRAGHRLPRAPRRARLAGAAAAAGRGRGARRGPDRRGARGHRRPHQRRRGLPVRGRARHRRGAAVPALRGPALPRARSRSAMGAVFTVPYARLDDWYDALPRCPRGLHHRRADAWPTTPSRSRTPSPGSDRVALVLGSEGHGLSARWLRSADRARGDPDGGRDRLAQRRPRPTAVACYATPGADGSVARDGDRGQSSG